MAVRAPIWLRDALRWRWTPTIALVTGALLYVLGALWLLPSEITFTSIEKQKGAGRGDAATLSDSAEMGIPAADTEVVDSPRIRGRRRARQPVAESPTEAPSLAAEAPQAPDPED